MKYVFSVLTLVVALFAWGCTQPSEDQGGIDPTKVPDSQKSSLRKEEVQRAVQRLFAGPEPSPVEEIGWPATQAGTLRLADRLPKAEVSSSWAPESIEGGLVELGPVTTRSADARIQTARAGSSGRMRWLTMPGVQTDAGRVGEIVLDLRIQGAPYFLLRWSRLGHVRIEVQEPFEFSRYRISTDDLPHWRGRLSWFKIGVPLGPPERSPAEIDVKSIRLLDRKAAFREPAGSTRRRLGRELRTALYLHGDTQVRFSEIAISEGVQLAMGLAVLGQPLQLEVSAEVNSEVHSLYQGEVATTVGWEEIELDFPPDVGNGEKGAIILEAQGPEEDLLFVANPTLFHPQEAPPRVIVYLVDTLGATHSSLYGYDRPSTPTLEKLATEGVWFKNAFANSSHTGESVPAMMTSLHTRSTGMTRQFSKLAASFATLQEAFAAAGYATAAFSTNANAGPSRGTDQGFDSFFDHIEGSTEEGALRTVPVPHVLSWLDRYKNRATFLYIHTAEPHFPYDPPPPFNVLFDPMYLGEANGYWRPSFREARRGTYDRRKAQHLKALYDGEVAFADEMLGTTLDLMKQLGLLRNTLLVFTADHGEAFGEHGSFGHGGYPYSELLRVPLLLWGPDRVPKGQRINKNVQLLDVMPTLLELMGLNLDAPLQGHSLAKLIRGELDPAFENRRILAARLFSDPPDLTLIHDRWKLNLVTERRRDPRFELFDIAVDPGEQVDLAGERPRIVRDLVRGLVAYHSSIPAYDSARAREFAISHEQIERLRALGYID